MTSGLKVVKWGYELDRGFNNYRNFNRYFYSYWLCFFQIVKVRLDKQDEVSKAKFEKQDEVSKANFEKIEQGQTHIKELLTNHVTETKGDIKELKTDVKKLLEKK